MSGSVDLRYATPLAATMSCDHRPVKGTQGFGAQVRILAPGNPDLSMIVLRMKLTGAGRMPEVGALAVDDAGVALVSEWIRSLAPARDCGSRDLDVGDLPGVGPLRPSQTRRRMKSVAMLRTVTPAVWMRTTSP